MNVKIRLATAWFGGCSGCHMSFLDLDEFLIDLVDAVEVVYSPIVDMKEYPENVDVCLIEGAICNEDNLELLHKIRQRTKVLVSFGDCAVTANVPAIRNQLGIMQVEPGKPFTFYLGASWDRSGDFTNHIQWEDYVKRFAERRDQPLKVTVGN